MHKLLVLIAAASLLGACAQESNETALASAAETESAEEFVARFNAEYKVIWGKTNAADWVGNTYINRDTAQLVALSDENFAAWHAGMVQEAKRYDGLDLDATTRRALDLVKSSAQMIAPDDDAKRKELATILTELKGMYGASKYCRSDTECFGGSELEGLMQQSKDYDELLEYWAGWREIAKPMRAKYERFVELSNEGAREFGQRDLGELWQSKYDMPAAEFAAETARL